MVLESLLWEVPCNLLCSLPLRGPGASPLWLSWPVHKLALFTFRGSREVAVTVLHPFTLCRVAVWCQLKLLFRQPSEEKSNPVSNPLPIQLLWSGAYFLITWSRNFRDWNEWSFSQIYPVISCSFVAFAVLFIKWTLMVMNSLKYITVKAVLGHWCCLSHFLDSFCSFLLRGMWASLKQCWM